MKRKWFVKWWMFVVVLFIACPSWAAHPLITDDTGTQGKGKFQLELNGQYDWDKEDEEGVAVKSSGGQAAAALSYGVSENVDLVLSLPYLWGNAEVNEVTLYDEKGIGDAILETKMRLFEKNGFSVALKPGISFPTGDEDKGLGAGKLGGHIFLIASEEIGSWAFHGNLGYIRNENDVEEHKDLWHASFAATWEVVKNLKLAADIGAERNPDEDAKDDPAFLIGGIIYSLNDDLDVDMGVKFGLTDPEPDFSLMAGVTWRF
jgi:hypothetical protein